MGKLEDMIDDVNLKINEITAITKCIRDSLECYINNNSDYSLSFSSNPQVNSNFNSNTYSYADFLDENNKAVYDALKVWTTPDLSSVSVAFPTAVKVSLSALPGTSSYSSDDETALNDALMQNCKPGRDSLLFDYPEICWLDPNNMSVGLMNTTVKHSSITGLYTLTIGGIKITPNLSSSFSTLQEAQNYENKLSDAVDNFVINGTTSYDKIREMHDEISTFTYYDTSAKFSSSAIGALITPGVVCEGYSKAFKLLCDRENIPCVLVFGNFDKDKMTGHMWDYVKMEDGKWYAVDVTWDDEDGYNGVVAKYDYFIKGSDSYFKNHTEETNFIGTVFTYPTLSKTDYSSTIIPALTTASATTSTTTTTTTTSTTTTTTTSTTTIPTTTSTTTTTTTTIPTTTSTTTTSTTAMPTTTSTSTTTETVYLKGDFNHDGSVDIADAVICAKSLCGALSGYNCDFDDDGIADIFDLSLLRQYIMFAQIMQ